MRLLDEPEEIERTIKRAVTDSGNEIRFSNDPERAGVNNLLVIYKVVTGKEATAVEADFADAGGYGELKSRVAEVVIDELSPIRARYAELMADVTELDRLLARAQHQCVVSVGDAVPAHVAVHRVVAPADRRDRHAGRAGGRGGEIGEVAARPARRRIAAAAQRVSGDPHSARGGRPGRPRAPGRGSC